MIADDGQTRLRNVRPLSVVIGHWVMSFDIIWSDRKWSSSRNQPLSITGFKFLSKCDKINFSKFKVKGCDMLLSCRERYLVIWWTFNWLHYGRSVRKASSGLQFQAAYDITYGMRTPGHPYIIRPVIYMLIGCLKMFISLWPRLRQWW